MTPDTRPELTVELATFLVPQPAAIAKLLAQHRDDGRGGCKICASGGQRGHLSWPCTIHAAATLAARTRAAVARHDAPDSTCGPL